MHPLFKNIFLQLLLTAVLALAGCAMPGRKPPVNTGLPTPQSTPGPAAIVLPNAAPAIPPSIEATAIVAYPQAPPHALQQPVSMVPNPNATANPIMLASGQRTLNTIDPSPQPAVADLSLSAPPSFAPYNSLADGSSILGPVGPSQSIMTLAAPFVPDQSSASGPQSIVGLDVSPQAVPDIAPELTPRDAPVTIGWIGQYVIEAGDSLEIQFRTAQELDQVVTVRPDGMISLPVVGDIPAAGQNPEMLRRSLRDAFANELKEPDITVIVRSFSGNSIYVGGEVFTPGRVPITGRVTTLNAIIMAGGFKDTADQRRVMVRRSDGTCCEFDMKSVIECKGGQNIQLRPYDVVYVPKSHIAKVNQFVEQYIDKVLPFSRSFGIFVSHNTGLASAVGGP